MWKLTGSSIIGSSHVKTGKPCQDSSTIFENDKGILIGIVADGLGSAEKSEVGSRLVVDTVSKVVTDTLASAFPDSESAWIDMLKNAFSQARAALEQKAAEIGCELRELGTTLLCFVVAPNSIAVGQIGDGAIVIQYADEKFETISSPQRGEFANETMPLTMAGAIERVFYQFKEVEIKKIAAFSDGLQNLALVSPTNEPFEAFFLPFFSLIEKSDDMEAVKSKISEFLGSEKTLRRTDDDKSLIIATKVTAEKLEL